MNRIEERLNQLKEKNEKALITYITAGLPDYEHTKNILLEQEKAGVDIVELGIPFSDPVADGPVIQDASYRAICNGATLQKTFDMMKELREAGCRLPIVFMMYYNTILHYGIEAFVKKCVEIGVDGLIIPDLPYEEQSDLKQYLEKTSTILIPLVAPTSKQRLKKILMDAKGFVYCVSSMGVTGQAADFHKEIKSYLDDVREHASIPVMMGFGIRSVDDVKHLSDKIDGVIVGTHFIQEMEKQDFSPAAAYEYCSKFKTDLKQLGA